LIAIGNFDGVHLGHARLILGVVEQARARGLLPCALTFHPHPARVLGRGAPRTLTRLSRKVELLSLASPELEVVVQPFDHELSQSSPREFAEQLVRVQRARRVIVGENFRFGKDRKGSLATLRALGEELGFEVGSTELFVLEDDVVSSSRIRDAVEAGEVELAERLLGRPHRLIGTVVRGHGRGRKLGFPTANLAAIEELLPKNGVYAGRALVAGRSLPAVLNVGVRPTFAPGDLSVEVHVFDLSTLDSSELSFDIVARIRDERRFASVEELAAQIARDVDVARQRLGSDPEPG
jgi:riboflavin kinase/FMN adenylyltransferase